jgi:hypothetical protein
MTKPLHIVQAPAEPAPSNRSDLAALITLAREATPMRRYPNEEIARTPFLSRWHAQCQPLVVFSSGLGRCQTASDRFFESNPVSHHGLSSFSPVRWMAFFRAGCLYFEPVRFAPIADVRDAGGVRHSFKKFSASAWYRDSRWITRLTP